jgi:hypothetical protein
VPFESRPRFGSHRMSIRSRPMRCETLDREGNERNLRLPKDESRVPGL